MLLRSARLEKSLQQLTLPGLILLVVWLRQTKQNLGAAELSSAELPILLEL